MVPRDFRGEGTGERCQSKNTNLQLEDKFRGYNVQHADYSQ